VGKSPIDRHFHSPTAKVNILHAKYASFWRGRVVIDLGFDVDGENGAKAVFIPAMLLNGLRRSINTIPILNI